MPRLKGPNNPDQTSVPREQAVAAIEPPIGLNSTQVGVLGELIVACQLILLSGGQFALFRPLADDDGVDSLLMDKLTRKVVPLQIKASLLSPEPKRNTVQFDVRHKTFRERQDGFVLAVLLGPKNAEIQWSWLFPNADLSCVGNYPVDIPAYKI